MKMHNDSSFPVLLSPGINFSVEPPVMEAPSWPYFDPDYETTCSRFTPPRYGALKFFTLKLISPFVFFFLLHGGCKFFEFFIWPAWVGCVALCRVVIENDTYEDVTVLKVGDLLVGGVFSFLLERYTQNRCIGLSRLMLWCGGFLWNLVPFLLQVNSGSTDMSWHDVCRSIVPTDTAYSWMWCRSSQTSIWR